MRSPRAFALLMCLICTIAAVKTEGQVTTGTPPFNSFSSGTDNVNLYNLNVHIDIPVLSKPGRGLNFNFVLTYDSSVWEPIGTPGVNRTWQLYPNGGLHNVFEGTPYVPLTGHLTFAITIAKTCAGGYYEYRYNAYTYVDPLDTPHPFNGTLTRSTGGGCGTTSAGFQNSVALDGSGYILSVPNVTTYYLSDKTGTQICLLSSCAPYGLTGRNGNQMTGDVSGNFYDTSSTTTPVVSIPVNQSPVKINYTGPSGPVSYTVKTTSYTVQTNFGCSGIVEHGAQSKGLLSEIDLPDNSKYTFTYEPTPGFPGKVTGRLASITFPTGGTISYKYTGSNNGIICGDGSAAGLQRMTPDSGTAFWNYTRTPGSGTYTTTVTDPQNNNTVIFFTGSLETQRQVYQGAINSANLLLTTTICYVGANNPQVCTATPQQPFIGQQVTTQLGGGNLTSLHAEQYDNYGNTTGTQDYDYGNGAHGSLLRQTTTSYASLTNIQAFPSQTVVKDGSGNIVQQTVFNYTDTVTSSSGTPQHTSPPGSRGNLQSVNLYTSASAYMTKSFTYFDTGTIQTSTDVNGAVTTNVFPDATSTCGNAFPRTVNKPLNMSQSSTWNCAGGVLTGATDENGNTTTIQYIDPYFWRPASVSYPDGGMTTWTYNSPTSLTTTTKMSSSQNIVATTLLDGLGRNKQTQLNSDPLGVDYVDTTYDSLGRVFTNSNPHRSTSLPTDGLTTTYYDALGRTCLIVPPDGTGPSGSGCPTSQPSNTIFTTYSNNTSTVTDQSGKSRKLVVNALGQLTQVTEDPAGLGYITSYFYDALGDLVSVVQNGSRQRNFAYDFLSRLTSATNPESGTVTYTYDANGNLGTRTSPAPNQTGSATVTASYAYDALHRLKQRTYSDTTAPVYLQYDATTIWGWTLNNTVGRLIAATSPTMGPGPGGTAENFSYDAMGRITQNGLCTPVNCGTGSFATNYAYNLAGNLTSFSNGMGVTLTQTIDAAGRLSKLTSSWNDAQHPGTLFTADPSTGYSPGGVLRKAALGNGLTITNMYNNRLQPCRLNLNSSGTGLVNCPDAVPSGNLLDFAYGYNSGTANNSNLASWSSVGSQIFTRSYGYDSLNRLSSLSDSASTQACKGLSWSYDAWGNLLAQNNTGGSCFTLSVSVGTNNRLGSPYTYDAAGNMIYDGAHSYTYDAENRLISVDGGSTATYIYDANGQRVRKTVGGVSTDFLRDVSNNVVAEWSSTCSCWSVIHVYANNGLLAEYWNSTTYFVHKDHLGSTRLITDLNKAVVDSLDYLPYGMQIAGGTFTTHKFTGKERDAESGLDHFDFRKYNSALGRWMSPDPAGAAFANLSVPQSWNLYSYVLNNPLRFTDPTGLYCYYGDTGDDGWSVADWSDPSQFDFQSNVKECADQGGVWHDLETDIQSITVTDTPMDPPNGIVQSIRDFVDAWSYGPTEGQIITQVNQCAAKRAVSLASLMGWNENNPWVNSLAGNDASALSNAVFGPGRGQAVAGLATSNPVKSVVADTMIDLAGQVPMGGTIYTTTGRSVMTSSGAAIDMTVASKTLADVIPAAVPKAGATALTVFAKAKVVFDAAAYLNALANCAHP